MERKRDREISRLLAETELETWITNQKIRKVIEKQEGYFNVIHIVLQCGRRVDDMDFQVQVEQVINGMVVEGTVNLI
jgi:hypothetical protein